MKTVKEVLDAEARCYMSDEDFETIIYWLDTQYYECKQRMNRLIETYEKFAELAKKYWFYCDSLFCGIAEALDNKNNKWQRNDQKC